LEALLFRGRRSKCLLADGETDCWGANFDGQLGSGMNPEVGGQFTFSTLPVAAVGITDAVTVAQNGYGTACAQLATGSIDCWGGNDSGQLGDGTTTNQNTPVPVSGLG
jgi:alpha-tubulin suppressor-like RCC1 family protein